MGTDITEFKRFLLALYVAAMVTGIPAAKVLLRSLWLFSRN